MGPIGRRLLLKAGLAAGLGCGFSSVVGARNDDAEAPPRKGDFLVSAAGGRRKHLTASDVRLGARPIFAHAMDPRTGMVRSASRLNQVLLLRLNPQALSRETRGRAVDGIVAYSAICTHTGCDVSEWLREKRVLLCPCHFSTFDPADGARVAEGVAPRPLPALPLALDRGRLRIAGPFTADVGFESEPEDPA
jgi:rieske iron-sulfur protein